MRKILVLLTLIALITFFAYLSFKTDKIIIFNDHYDEKINISYLHSNSLNLSLELFLMKKFKKSFFGKIDISKSVTISDNNIISNTKVQCNKLNKNIDAIRIANAAKFNNCKLLILSKPKHLNKNKIKSEQIITIQYYLIDLRNGCKVYKCPIIYTNKIYSSKFKHRLTNKIGEYLFLMINKIL